MVWRLFFVITVIIALLMYILALNTDYSSISSFQYFTGELAYVCIALILGVFYSLGWKQKLFSKKSINIFIAVFILSMILSIIDSTVQVYSVFYKQAQNSIQASIASIIASSVYAVIANLFLIPFYIGLYKYKKNFDSLVQVEKTYWKIFALYCIIMLAGCVVSSITKYTHFVLYNIFDYISILSCIYEIMFIIGFAWNVRIFSKLFWQVTAIPYVLLMCLIPFFISDTFNQDFRIKEIIFGNPISIAIVAVICIVFIYVIYMYAYKEKN